MDESDLYDWWKLGKVRPSNYNLQFTTRGTMQYILIKPTDLFSTVEIIIACNILTKTIYWVFKYEEFLLCPRHATFSRYSYLWGSIQTLYIHRHLEGKLVMMGKVESLGMNCSAMQGCRQLLITSIYPCVLHAHICWVNDIQFGYLSCPKWMMRWSDGCSTLFLRCADLKDVSELHSLILWCEAFIAKIS